MVLSGKGRIVTQSRGAVLVYLPKKVVNDSQMPFAVGDEVSIRIDGNKVIIEKNVDCITVAGEKMYVGDLIIVDEYTKAHLVKPNEVPTHIITSIEGDNYIRVTALGTMHS